MSGLHLTHVTLFKEIQMFSWKKIFSINQTSLLWEKLMRKVTTMTFFIASPLCSTTTTNHPLRSRPGHHLSCKTIRLSTRSHLQRWMGSERTYYQLTWETPLPSMGLGEVLLKRPHSATTSFRGCWWMRNAGKTCPQLLSLLDFQFLHLVQKLGCFSNRSKSQLRRVLSLKKKEVKS